MKELTSQSFSDALYDCYNTPNSRILIVFGRYKQMHDFAYSLRANPIHGAEVSMTQEFDTFRDKIRIRFGNGSSIMAIHLSELPVHGEQCDEMLCASGLYYDESAMAYMARYERSDVYRRRKSLSHKPVDVRKEESSEPDTDALDTFLSEFSITKS